MKQLRFFLSLVFIFYISCSNQQNIKIEEKSMSTPLPSQYDTIQINPINYLDFEYNKVIAFFELNAYELRLEKDNYIPEIHDTIQQVLTNKQIIFLNEFLSGKHRKQVTKKLFPADCFNPRHNIVFLNKENKIINYISICFECDRSKKSKPDLADFENMETFFKSIDLPVFENPNEYKSYLKNRKF